MKKITAISALSTLAVAALLASGPAAAQQVTNTNNALLSFQGAVTDSTCTISSSAGDPMLITLPTVSTVAFNSTAGTTTGTTPFTITVKNCTASLTQAVPFFDYANTTNANVTSAGRLKNTAPSGANVDLQISDTVSGQVVGLNTPWASVGPLPALTPQKVTRQTISGTNATFNFTVQYYATLTGTTAGPVTSNVPIIMQYN